MVANVLFAHFRYDAVEQHADLICWFCFLFMVTFHSKVALINICIITMSDNNMKTEWKGSFNDEPAENYHTQFATLA